jgi:pilus assembly protein Flp/PilA
MSQRNFAWIPVANFQKLVNRGNPKPHGKINTIRGENKMERIKNFFKNESGASAVEYGLLVTLIALAIIVGAGLLGTNLNALFNNAAGQLAT